MNDNSWEKLLKKQQKKFHFAILVLTPVIAVMVIMVINNRDLIMTSHEKSSDTLKSDTLQEHLVNDKKPQQNSHKQVPAPATEDRSSKIKRSDTLHHKKEKVQTEDKKLQLPAHQQKTEHLALIKKQAVQAPVISQKPDTNPYKQPSEHKIQETFTVKKPDKPAHITTPLKASAGKSHQSGQKSAPDKISLSKPLPNRPPHETPPGKTHAFTPQSAPPLPVTKEAIVNHTAEIVFSEELPPITCSLQSRKDIVIKLTLELFFHDEDMRRSLRLQRDQIRLVVLQMVKAKELSEMNVDTLEHQLGESMQRVFGPTTISSVNIKNIQIVKAP